MPSGKGRNVYYSNADFLVLSVIEHLLSIGLNFEMCHVALETLRKREPWLFEESVTEDKMKRLMFLLSRSPEQPLQLMEFDQQAALEALCPGFLTSPAITSGGRFAIAILIILTQDMFRAFLMCCFLMQCETRESRFYKALRIVVRNPGLSGTNCDSFLGRSRASKIEG